MSKKRIAHKIEIHIDETGGTTYTKIGGVKSIGDPGLSREAVDLLCMDSDVSADFASPVLTLGDCNFDLFWDEEDADQQRLVTEMTGAQHTDVADLPSFKIVFNNYTPARKMEFKGWVKDLSQAPHEVKGEVIKPVVINVNSVPVPGVN